MTHFHTLHHSRTPFIENMSSKLNMSTPKDKRGHRTINGVNDGVQNRSEKKGCKITQLVKDRGQKCN